MSASNWVHLEDCDVLRVTGKAILVFFEGEQHWFPKSQVSEADKYEEGDSGLTVSVTTWIAEQKGIET